MSFLRWSSLRTLGLAAILVAAIVGVYACSLRGEFLWDDNLHITENPTIVGPMGLKEIWTTARSHYFPLVLTNFWVQHALWGLEPFGYRVITLAFHVLAALLLWRVLLRLRVSGAWLGAALWALHPVQVESVAWICELKNTQSAVFFLGAIWFWIRGIEGAGGRERGVDAPLAHARGYIHKQYAGALVFAVLAILSKPSTVMLPIALALCTWWMHGRLQWRDLVRLAPFLVLSGVAAGWTIWEQKFHSGAIGVEWEQSWPERFAIAGRAVWFYLGKLLWPEPLIFIYPRWSIDAGNMLSYLPLAAVFAVLALLAWWPASGGAGGKIPALPSRATFARPVLFAALYFGALLFPVLGFFNVYFFRYSFVGDHFQYLASMGPLALLAAGVMRLPLRVACFVAPACVVALGVLTWRHTGTFRNMETLWRSTVTLHPECRMAWLNLGDTYSRQRRSAEAIEAFRTALQIAPDDASGHNDLGCELVIIGRPGEAVPHLERAVALKPIAEHHSNLGNALRKVGRIPEALAHYERALQLDPNHAASHNNLGAELAEAGRYEDALKHFEAALRLHPNDAGTVENFGNALRHLGRAAEAAVHLEAALRLDPARAVARKGLADLMFADGRQEAAFALLEGGVKAAPHSAEAHNNLGSALALAGRAPEAIQHFREAVRLLPDFAVAHLNLGTAVATAGRLPEAIEHLTTAVALRPDLAEAHGQLGVALVNADRLEDAVVPFQQALRLRPDSPELHNNFGQVLRALGRTREAFEHLEEAARLQRERPRPRAR